MQDGQTASFFDQFVLLVRRGAVPQLTRTSSDFRVRRRPVTKRAIYPDTGSRCENNDLSGDYQIFLVMFAVLRGWPPGSAVKVCRETPLREENTWSRITFGTVSRLRSVFYVALQVCPGCWESTQNVVVLAPDVNCSLSRIQQSYQQRGGTHDSLRPRCKRRIDGRSQAPDNIR